MAGTIYWSNCGERCEKDFGSIRGSGAINILVQLGEAGARFVFASWGSGRHKTAQLGGATINALRRLSYIGGPQYVMCFQPKHNWLNRWAVAENILVQHTVNGVGGGFSISHNFCSSCVKIVIKMMSVNMCVEL